MKRRTIFKSIFALAIAGPASFYFLRNDIDSPLDLSGLPVELKKREPHFAGAFGYLDTDAIESELIELGIIRRGQINYENLKNASTLSNLIEHNGWLFSEPELKLYALIERLSN